MLDPATRKRIEQLEARVAELERSVSNRDYSIQELTGVGAVRRCAACKLRIGDGEKHVCAVEEPKRL